MNESGDLVDEGPFRSLSALDDDGTEALPGRFPGGGKHLLLTEFITMAADIATNAAVKAVFDAAVGNLDQPAQVDLGPDCLALDAVGLVQQGLVEIRVLASQGFREPLAAMEKRTVHNS